MARSAARPATCSSPSCCVAPCRQVPRDFRAQKQPARPLGHRWERGDGPGAAQGGPGSDPGRLSRAQRRVWARGVMQYWGRQAPVNPGPEMRLLRSGEAAVVPSSFLTSADVHSLASRSNTATLLCGLMRLRFALLRCDRVSASESSVSLHGAQDNSGCLSAAQERVAAVSNSQGGATSAGGVSPAGQTDDAGACASCNGGASRGRSQAQPEPASVAA